MTETGGATPGNDIRLSFGICRTMDALLVGFLIGTERKGYESHEWDF